MPELKIIVIIGLILLSYLQYAMPDKANQWVDPLYGKAKSYIDQKNPLSKEDDTSSPCPDNVNKVCGSNGKTYKNICYAALDNVMEVTEGECE